MTVHLASEAWGEWVGAARNVLAIASLLGGVFFMLVGAIGLVRLPDVYGRLHAASKCTTLGFTGMLLAACFHLAEPKAVSLAMATIVFTFVAAPIGSHLLAKAAHHGGPALWTRTLSDELADDKADPERAASDEVIGLPDADERWAAPRTAPPDGVEPPDRRVEPEPTNAAPDAAARR